MRSAGLAVAFIVALSAGCGDESGSTGEAVDCEVLVQVMVMCGQVDEGDDDFRQRCDASPSAAFVRDLDACRQEAAGDCAAFTACADQLD